MADTTLLDAKVLVQTNKPSTLSFQPEGTNTAGDLGAAVSLTYQNRNLFRGSELFSVQLRGSYEAIRGLEGYSNQDYFEYSVESRLSFPRFIVPFLKPTFRRSIIATSEVSLLYDSQDRPEFHRRVLSAGWHYQWKQENSYRNYRLDLIDLNYVFMPWISQTFRDEYLSDNTNSNAILSITYEQRPSGISQTEYGQQMRINVSGNTVSVTDCPHMIEVFTLQGHHVVSLPTSGGKAQFPLPAGQCYLIKAGKKTVKVLL